MIRMLVELDAILDTRLAMVELLNPSLVEKLLTPEYANRLSDEFNLLVPELDNELFKRAYSERNLETLYYARPTDILLFVNATANAMLREVAKGQSESDNVEIDINYYPYPIPNDALDVWVESITAALRLDKKVNMVSIAPTKLTTDAIRNGKWEVLIMYNLEKWVKAVFNRHDVRPTPIPKVVVIAPTLVSSIESVVSEAHAPAPTKERLNPFDAMRIMFSEIIGIKFISVAEFSLMGLTERVVQLPIDESTDDGIETP